VAWLDPLEELDELGLVDGDWSWPLLDELEPFFVLLLFELLLSLDVEDGLLDWLEWPA